MLANGFSRTFLAYTGEGRGLFILENTDFLKYVHCKNPTIVSIRARLLTIAVYTGTWLSPWEFLTFWEDSAEFTPCADHHLTNKLKHPPSGPMAWPKACLLSLSFHFRTCLCCRRLVFIKELITTKVHATRKLVFQKLNLNKIQRLSGHLLTGRNPYMQGF